VPLALLTALLIAAPCDAKRAEMRIPGGDPGVEIFVMHVPAPRRRGAVMLMHGAGAGSSSVYDLQHRDYSLMRTLACAGLDAWAVDVRGFGGSTMPAALKKPAEGAPPVGRAEDAVRDLGAAIRHARRVSRVDRVDLFGWSWGSVVSGLFAGRHPEQVRRLILYAPVFDRRRPKRHKTVGAWRNANKPEILAYFDEQREERAIWDEHIDAMFRFAGGDDLRLPNGPYRDIYGPDAPIWDPAAIRAPTLVIRGDRDPASLRGPVGRLFDALVNAPEKRWVEVGGASHFLMRERGYKQLHRMVLDYLQTPSFRVPAANQRPTSNRGKSVR